MKKLFYGIVSMLIISSCANSNSQKTGTTAHQQTTTEVGVHKPDTTGVLQAFEQLKTDKDFLDGLALSKGEVNQETFYLPDHAIIFGDLNQDHVADALLLFSVQGRNGGNIWDVHYAPFLNENEKWKVQPLFHCGGNSWDNTIEFTRINNGKINGWNVPAGNDDPDSRIPIVYVFQDGEIYPIQIPLTETADKSERPSINVEGITSDKNIFIPFESTIDNLHKLLGEEEKKELEEAACDSYFEDQIGFLKYRNLYFGISRSGQAVLSKARLKDTSIKLQTSKGTIDTSTTTAVFKRIFPQAYEIYLKDWKTQAAKGEEITIALPSSEESDDLCVFKFDKSGKLIGFHYLIQC